MDEIKVISGVEFNIINSQHPFQRQLLVKDYYLTLILYLIRNVKGIYFKGGTAINKIFLSHARLSEDIDLTLTRNEKQVKEEIKTILGSYKIFRSIKEGKDVDGFLRIIINCKSELGDSDLFIDLNQREKLLLPTEENEIKHFYCPFLPEFSIKTAAKEEMVADKVAATIDRNKPRDHYDVYKLIEKKIPINMSLVKKKCHKSDFSIIKMFNNAKKLKNRWDKDMEVLLAKPVTFQEVIRSLAKHFSLKEEKERIKQVL